MLTLFRGKSKYLEDNLNHSIRFNTYEGEK